MRKHYFLFFFIFLLTSFSEVLAQACPTNNNTVFTTTDVNCFGAGDGTINVVFNDGVPPYSIAFAYDVITTFFYIPGFDFTLTQNAANDFTLSGLPPGIYLIRVNCSDGSSTINVGDTNPDGLTHIHEAALVLPPNATAASNIGCNDFDANWGASTDATGYRLDVATDAGFTSILAGYNDLDVGNVTTYNISGLTEGTDYYYRVRAYRNACPSTTDSNVIQTTTAPLPNLQNISTASPDQACEGEDYYIGIDGSEAGITYEIYVDGNPSGVTTSGTGAVLNVGPINSLAAGSTYTLTVNATTGIGCSQLMTGSVSLTINPIPAAPTPSNDGPACEGDDVQLTTPAVAGATFSWTGPNGFSSNLREPILNSIAVADAGVYSVTVTVLGCTSPAGSTTVVVNPVPALPTPTNDGPTCEGDDVQLTTLAVAGATYAWSGPNGFSSNLREPVLSGVVVADAGVYSVTVTLSGCTSAAGNTTVVVNPVPAMPAPSNDGPACEGDDVQLTTAVVAGATYAWTGPNGFSSNLREPLLSAVVLADAGVYSVVVSVSGCASSAGNTTLIVNPTPATPAPSNDSPACEGADVQLTTPVVAGATYSWTGPNGFSSNIREPILNNVAIADAGVYSVTVTVGVCASAAGNTTVVVNPIPGPPAPSNDGPACEGDDVQLTTATVAGATYLWSGPNGFSSNLREPILSSVVVADAGIYSVTVSVGGCISPAGNTTVIVNPVPAAPTPSNDGPACEGSDIQLTTPVVAGATYTWSGPNGFSSNLREPVLNSVVVADAGAYSVTLTVAACTSPAGSTTVVVNPAPVVPTPSNDGPACEGDDVQLTTPAVAGATYLWSGPNGFSSNLREPILIAVSVADAGVYSVIVTLGVCTSPTGNTTVVVNPAPAVPTPSNDGPACEGDDVQLTTPTIAGATYNWSGPNGFSSNLREPILNGVTVADAGVYSVTITVGTCTSPAGNTTVVVNPAPLAPAPGNDGPACEGDDVQLTTAAVAGAIYAWTGPNGFSSNLQEPVLNGVTIADAGVYSVTVSVGGCISPAGTTTVVVEPIPGVPTPSNDGPACEGDDIQLTTPAVAGAIYSWSGPNGFSSNLQEPILVGVLVADAGVYSVTVSVGGCTSAAGNTTVVVNPSPATPTPSNDGPACEGDDVQLTTAAVAGATYSWSGPNGFSSNLQEPILSNVVAADAGIYSVTITLAGCTSAAGNTTVIVNPIPATPTPSNDGPVCEGLDIQLTTALVAGGVYQWTGPNGFNSNLQEPVLSAVTVAVAGVYSVTVSVGGCVSLAGTTTVVVNPAPDATIADPGPFCLGDPAVNLTAATAGGIWSGTGITDAVAGTFDPFAAGLGSHVIQYQITGGGCTSVDNITINVVAIPDATIDPAGPFCDNDAPVNLTAVTPGGTWSGPGITDPVAGTFDPSIAGLGSHIIQYDIVLPTCSNSSTTTIDVNPAPDATINPAGPFCESDIPVNLTAVTPGGTWSGPGITDPAAGTFDPAAAGNGTHNIQYEVTVGGCTAISNMNIDVNPGPDASINPAGPFCEDAVSVNLSAVTPGGTWSGPGIIDPVAGTFDPITAGVGIHLIQYQVSGGGCTSVGTTNIEVVALPVATITSSDGDNIICFGDILTFTAAPGGALSYEFFLNGVLDQNNGNNIYTNAALADMDSVNVRVTTALGCSADAIGIVTTVTQMIIDLDSTNISTCGAMDGEIVINNISGGIGPYDLSWTGPNGYTSTVNPIGSLERGTYDLTVLDQGSGCTEFLSIYMGEPANFTLSYTKLDVSTPGGNDGSIDLTITGGSGNFTTGWTGPNGYSSSNEDISGLKAGVYVGTVTDNVSGCTDAVNVLIDQPASGGLTLSATKTDVTTCGANDGTINLIITGGSGDYAVSWTGPNGFTANTQNLANLEGGLYIATVTDNVTLVTAQWTVLVDEPISFSLSTTVTDISYCTSMDGAIDLTVNGGSGDFSFLWSGLGGLVYSSMDQNINGLELGSYRVIVTDNVSGCIDSIDAFVGRPAICDQPCAFDVEATTNNITCPGNSDGVAVINVISGGSGNGNYYVSLDTGATFIPFMGTDITSILNQGQGSYLFIAIDSVTLCMDTTVANIGVSTDLMTVIDVDDPGCDLNDGIISFNVSGGLVPFEVDLIHSDGFVENQSGTGFFQFRDLLEGRYAYVIREQSGCEIVSVDSIELITNCPGGCTTLTASAHSFEDATCATTPDGKAIIDVAGGISPYEYSLDGLSWISFVSGNVINQLPSDGSYNIIVRQDSLNPTCRVEVGVVINGPAPIVLEDPIITVDQANCNINNGSVKIGRITGGTTPYDYMVDEDFITLPADSIIPNLRAGLHQFSAIDDLGCRADFPFSVTSPGAVIADAEEVPVTCADIELKAGIRVTVDLITTDVSGPYEAVIISDSAPEDSLVYSIPDSGLRTVYGLDKGFYEVIVRAVSGLGCAYTESVGLINGVFPVDFDIISYDSIVGCSGDFGSVTIDNVIGDVDTTFYVHLVNTSNLILDTYEMYYPELENGFTIDETNSDNLLSGTYYIRVIQKQVGCPTVEATSPVFTIYEPSGDLGFEVMDDGQSFPDQPTGYIEGQVIPSGGDPYEGLIQLLEPSVPLSISEVIAFNDARDWEQIEVSGDLSGLYIIRFDDLWPGRYEISIEDKYGCEISVEHVVDRDSAIFIPNVFTPNGDGYNDVFYIRNLPESGTEVLISNRYGRTVFETSNYTFDNLWDGGDLSDGVYYYNVVLSNGESYTGWLELWRGSRP